MAEYIRKQDVLDLIHFIQARTHRLDESNKVINGVGLKAFLDLFEERVNKMDVESIEGDSE